jgi:hypothetical protein
VSAFFATVSLFIKAYWKFFVAVVGIIGFIALVVWFFKGAFAPSRDYEVTIEGDGQSVTVAGGEAAYAPVVAQKNIGKGTKVTLVNRSGDTTVQATIAATLSDAGFIVATSTDEVGAVEEKTVVVYNPSLAPEAVAVSELLDNALLSAFTSATTSDSSIVVYIGTQSILPE